MAHMARSAVPGLLHYVTQRGNRRFFDLNECSKYDTFSLCLFPLDKPSGCGGSTAD